jgi:hypothetical protein
MKKTISGQFSLPGGKPVSYNVSKKFTILSGLYVAFIPKANSRLIVQPGVTYRQTNTGF